MKRYLRFSFAALLLVSFTASFVHAAKHRKARDEEWIFAVSGDSRNCGDIVMPAIAADALKAAPLFYVHLGDFRWGSHIDDDLAHDTQHPNSMNMEQYLKIAWQDFIDSQLAPFGKTPIYLGIGNHELNGHTREQYLTTFRPWLNHGASSTAYYRWKIQGVDFIMMDNASEEQFDTAQMTWFRKILAEDEADAKVKTVVVGMHEALPDSISFNHSMSQSTNPNAISSGREVYQKLLHARDQSGKNVYVLASHSHYYMDGTFNTPYWHGHGGVLPGWIVGTAGAVRYQLPENSSLANEAKAHVYGYLLGHVGTTGKIRFEFHQLNEDSVPAQVVARFQKKTVHTCFEENSAHN